MALTAVQVAALAYLAGFRGNDVAIATAIAKKESNFNPKAHNPNAGTGDNSYGLWQINMLGGLQGPRLRMFGISSNAQLFDPATNAKAAKVIYGQQGWRAWSVYKKGAYLQALPEARAAAATVEAALRAGALPGGGRGAMGGVPKGPDDILKGLIGAAGSAIGAAGSAVGGAVNALPGPNPLDALSGLAAPLEAIAAFAKFVIDPTNWRRVAFAFVGLGLLVVAAVIVSRDTVAQAASLATTVATKGAAKPEAA